MTLGILINAIFFFGMGLSAFIRPPFVISFVQLIPETVDARNEVRAVYGGFGLAISALLLYAAYNSDIRSGVLLAVAAALFGMSFGRAVSLFIERPGKWPIIFMLMEATLAGLLFWSR